MLTIGCHLSTSSGLVAMVDTATSIGANTFAYFTRNPRGGNVRALEAGEAQAFADAMAAADMGTLVAHAPYTYNLASAKPDVRTFGRRAMAEDLERLETLPAAFYNFHPGSHTGLGVDEGIRQIAEGLNEVITPGQQTRILLETMAGKGTELGGTFEQLARIIESVDHDECLGVCLDTCHVSDAGYDIVNDLGGVLDHFDEVIGIDRLCALHLNDSKNPLGAHKDRHECIGQGFIGLDTFAAIVREPRLRHLPMVLETPNELPGYAREIEQLRACAAGVEEG